jgi:phosphoglycolate phosphatase-like HAD superfamily hydrolase
VVTVGENDAVSTPDTILLDLDGTLVDSADGILG